MEGLCMGKIRVGIIGCGNIANTKHMPTLAKFSDRVEMTAFCDIVPERAEKAAKDYGVSDTRVYKDYKECVKDPNVDVIHVCTPNRSHSMITVAALENGKHVMCEKPMAISAAEAQKMADAAKRSGKLLSIGYQNRFRTDVQALKKMIDQGELGEIYYAKAHALRRRGIPNWGVFTNKEEQGGGPLIDIGTHSLDLTLWMMDNYEPVSVTGVVFNKLGRTLRGEEQGTDEHWDPDKYEVEDAAFGFIKFKNGAAVYLETSWALNTLDQRQAMNTLYGTKAGCSMEFKGEAGTDRQLVINKVIAGKQAVMYVDTKEKAAASSDLIFSYPGADLECETWLDALEGKGELVVKPEQALVVTKILEAVYESARTGKSVHFD
jgi:predicted dehydrogenase